MTRFVVLATGRTGSTLLGNALADHPEILFYGELFHAYEDRRRAEAARRTMGAGVERHLPHGVPVCEPADDGREYITRLFSQRAEHAAIGFKLMYDQAREGAAATVWDALRERTSIRVVHLTRRNLLESLISIKRAELTRVWHSRECLSDMTAFRLNPQECQEYFDSLVAMRRLAAPLLESRPVLTLEYGELAAEFESTMRKAFSFLEVAPNVTVRKHLAKIARLAPHDEILNYAQLKRNFEHTPYAEMFS